MKNMVQLPEIDKIYVHYKEQNRYVVLMVSEHTETGELLVSYRPVGPITRPFPWTRPAAMWFEQVGVQDDGKTPITRFTLK